MYRYDFDGLHEITDDGRDEDNEYIECFTCRYGRYKSKT